MISRQARTPDLRELLSTVAKQRRRVRQLVASEQRSGKHGPEVRRNIALLADLEELVARLSPVQEASAIQYRHPTYSFLSSEQAHRLLIIEKLCDSGQLDPIELYRAAGVMIKIERALQADSNVSESEGAQ